MHRSLAALLVALSLALAACGPSAVSPSPAPPGSPSTSPVASADASAGPSAGPVESPEEAAQAVLAFQPELERFGLTAFDPEMIGQCCFYRVREVPDGYEVEVEVGWGDCPSGCINRHHWLYGVSSDGAVQLLGDEGDPIPVGPWPPEGDIGG